MQRFADNEKHFATNSFGELVLDRVGHQLDVNAGFLLELNAVGEQPAVELGGGDAHRLERADEAAELVLLLLDDALQPLDAFDAAAGVGDRNAPSTFNCMPRLARV
jgi:hypothetical protein